MDNAIYIFTCFAVIFLVVLYAPKVYNGKFIWKCVNAAYNNETSAKIIQKGKMRDIRKDKNEHDE